jgi:hypothetical protein
MKTFKWILLAVLVIGLGLLAWHIFSPYKKTEPLDAIPPDAVMIIETNNLFDAWDKITTNRAWEKLKKQPIFAKMGKGVQMMDTIIQSNKQLSEFVGHRQVFVSMHMTGSGKYDFAYVIDLRRISKILKLKDLIGSFSTSSLKVTKLKGTDKDIFQIEMKSTGQKFYCYFNNNLFVGSFTQKIINKSHSVEKEKSFQNDPFFKEIMDQTSSSGIFRLYINYRNLDDYLRSMVAKLDENTKSFLASVRYTGLTFDIDRSGNISCDGYTMINDTVHSSLKAFINSGMGNSSIEEVLPGNFSNSVSLCFNSFTDYFDNIQESLKATPYSYDSYQKQISALEDYLGITVRENFLDWIGEEVALAQMEPMGVGKDNEFAVFIKTKSINDAKENLALIAKRIKNRTPVKIATVDYKGNPINYLAVKGFFKMILGKYFQDLESPYYTFIDDYVVLSNHPQVLKKVIDAHVDESYLEKQKYFSDFYSSFGRKSNALVIINTESFLKSLKYDLRPETFKQMQENQTNLISYPYMGFQLSRDGDYFKTRFYAFFKEDEEVTEPEDAAEVDSLAMNDSIRNMVWKWVDIADSYVAIDVKQENYIESYPGGKLKVSFELKDGFRNGKYREYYENGQEKIKGEYEDDKKEGTWKFYNENGDLIQKIEFEKGERVDN